MSRWKSSCSPSRRSSIHRPRMSFALALADRRVALVAAPAAAAPAALEVAFVGCCPNGRDDAAASEAVARLGLQPAPGWFDQPVPVDGWHAFLSLFGADPGDPPSEADSLPGAAFWLPDAVADFFAAGGRRAWIVRVPPAQGEDAYVPPGQDVPGVGAPARGVVAACAGPPVGLMILPNLERLYAIP